MPGASRHGHSLVGPIPFIFIAGCSAFPDETSLPMSADDTQSPEGSQPSVDPENDRLSIDDHEPSEDSKPLASSDGVSLQSSDALARAISSTLGAVFRDFDRKAENAAKSQDQVSAALDRLTGELDRLLDDAPLPFIAQHVAKISSVRRRVTSMNSVLKSIQWRIDNIDRMLSVGTSLEKSAAESSGKNQH